MMKFEVPADTFLQLTRPRVCVAARRLLRCAGGELLAGETAADGFRIRAAQRREPAARVLLHLR